MSKKEGKKTKKPVIAVIRRKKKKKVQQVQNTSTSTGIVNNTSKIWRKILPKKISVVSMIRTWYS